MQSNPIVLFPLLALMFLADGYAAAPEQSARDPKRESGSEADRLAIAKLTLRLIDAFEQRDAAAVAAEWTDQGEFIRNDGEPIRGRDQLQKGYAEFFSTLKGDPKLDIKFESVRFPSADTAVTAATLLVRNDGEIVASARQEFVAVREKGQWKVAVIRESDRDIKRDASLEDLHWLIGTWQAVATDRQVTITYAWDQNKAFIRGQFMVKAGDRVIESGTETLAKDHAVGVIRSWVFQSDGAFGDGVWHKEGKKWSVDVHATKADGKQLTGTLIYIEVNPDTFTWQAVNLALDGEAMAHTPPIKVARQKPSQAPR